MKTKELEQYDIFWIEEPVPFYDMKGLAAVTREVDTMVAAGENITSKHLFGELLGARSIDVVQPDAMRIGGITEMHKIAAMASAWDVPFSPHHLREISIHLVASCSTGMIIEYLGLQSVILDNVFVDFPRPKDGCLELPQKPGLGWTLNEDAVKEYRT